jgi:hypothetical protein
MEFAMVCKTFVQFNGTHNTIVIHFSFPEENQMKKSETSDYDNTYNETFLTIERTDTNQQQFKMDMS